MTKTILELILTGAKVWKDERALGIIRKAEKLMEKIQEVEDSGYYHKNMEAKGLAERELHGDAMKLKMEFTKAANK